MSVFVVATPIGNLGDITFRAVETLKSVDVIACEDTRTTKNLCDKFEIKTRLISYHKYSENARLELFLGYLSEGKSIAIVSDAGTPTISDPGAKLVEAAVENGYKVVPIVGASAVMALLSAIPREKETFRFIGFLPRVKSQIQEIVKKNEINTVFYESPKRLVSTLLAINEVAPEIKIAIGRELTKKFEEIVIDTPKNLSEYFQKNVLKGEIAGMFYGETLQVENCEIIKKIKELKALNLSNKDICAILNTLYKFSKNEVYKLCVEM